MSNLIKRKQLYVDDGLNQFLKYVSIRKSVRLSETHRNVIELYIENNQKLFSEYQNAGKHWETNEAKTRPQREINHDFSTGKGQVIDLMNVNEEYLDFMAWLANDWKIPIGRVFDKMIISYIENNPILKREYKSIGS